MRMLIRDLVPRWALVMVLTVVLGVGLTGCGDEDTPTPTAPTPTPPVVTPPPAEEPPAEEPPAEEPPAEEPPAEEPPAEEPPAEEEEEEEPPVEEPPAEEAEEEEEEEEEAEEPPAAATLEADPTSVVAGSPVMLTWTATNASEVTLTANDVSVTDASLMVMDGTGGSTLTVMPTEETVYVLTAVGIDGSMDATATVTVMVTQPGMAMATLEADPTSVVAGSPVMLTWTATNASEVTLTANGMPHTDAALMVMDGTGGSTLTVMPTEMTTVYVLTAVGIGGSENDTATTTVMVTPMSSATITRFDSVSFSHLSGTVSVTLDWAATGVTEATTVELEIERKRTPRNGRSLSRFTHPECRHCCFCPGYGRWETGGRVIQRVLYVDCRRRHHLHACRDR